MNKKIKLTALAVALSLAFTACSNNNNNTAETKSNAVTSAKSDEASNKKIASNEDKSNEKSTSNEEDSKASKFSSEDIVLRRSLSAPHGEGSFARTVVVTQADKIITASLDEFQYFDEKEFKALPNQDGEKEFKKGAKEGKILGSKVENSDAYSKLMEEKAGSTVTIKDNFKAIENFVSGKTISEIEEVINNAEDGKAIDAVSGATLVDTKAYLKSIVDTAKNDKFAVKADTQSVDNLTLKSAFGGRNTDNSVSDVFVLLQNDKIVATSIDEYQYFGEKGVPNSDKKFGENYADKKNQLASKLENDREYSALMKEHAKAKNDISENFKAIEEYTKGKTAEEIKKIADENEKGKAIDEISGATLTDAVGYLDVIYDAASK